MVVIKTMRTQACVTMLSFLQPGLANGSIHALMVHTAVELDVAVKSSPGYLSCFCLRTVAAVGRSSVLTPASVFTWLTLTLVHVLFTQLTCRNENLPISSWFNFYTFKFHISKCYSAQSAKSSDDFGVVCKLFVLLKTHPGFHFSAGGLSLILPISCPQPTCSSLNLSNDI